MRKSTMIKIGTLLAAAFVATVASVAAGAPSSAAAPSSALVPDCVHARCEGSKSCSKLKSACHTVLGKWGCRTRDKHGVCVGGQCKKCYD